LVLFADSNKIRLFASPGIRLLNGQHSFWVARQPLSVVSSSSKRRSILLVGGFTLHALLQQPSLETAFCSFGDSAMSTIRARLIELLKEHALCRGHFILASGQESTYLIDGRMVTLHPEGALLVGRLMFEELRLLNVDAVGGLTLGADPIATSIALVSYLEGHPIPAFIVRKEAKSHGRRKLVEGPLPDGANRVAIVEDTITTGQSVFKAIHAVEDMGCKVIAVLALVDRLQGGRETLEGAGYPFLPLFTIRDFGIE